MLSLAVLERRVDRRSRRLRGLRFAGLAFAVCVVPLLLFAGGRVFGLWPKAAPFPLVWLAALPFFVAAAAFAFGHARRPNVPLLLLKVDLALGTGERLSALRELRETGRGRPFRRRIEKALEGFPLRLKKALPLGVVPVLVPALGALALAGAAFLFSLEPLALSTAEQVLSQAPASSPLVASRPTPDRTSADAAAGLPRERVPQGTPTPPAGKMPDQTLDDLLAGVSGSPGSEGILSESVNDFGDLAQDRKEGAASLSEVLSQIEERLAQRPGPLTPEERQSLSELMDQTADQSLREAIEALLNEEDPEALGENVAKARVLSEGETAQQAATPPEGAEAPPPASSEDGETSAWGASGERPPGTGSSENEGPTEGGTGAGSERPGVPGEEKDASLVGGDEEASPLASDRLGAPSPAAGFVPEDLAGIVGKSGEFQDFLTKGVPLEALPQPEGGLPRLALDYDALRAVLAGRSLPPSAQDSVKRYFESITQGGP